MKFKAHFEVSNNLDDTKYSSGMIGGNYPHKFYPTPLWNTRLEVIEFEMEDVKEIFDKEKHIHNKLFKLLFITNDLDRIIFMPSKFKHWIDCGMAQEYLINVFKGDLESK